MPSPLDTYPLDYWLLAQSSDVVVARTDRVGPAPRSWSGFELALQHVDLSLLRPLSERERTGTVALDVPVIEGAPTAAEEPGLASWWATPETECVLFLREGEPRLANQELGVLPSGDADRVEALIGGPIPVAVESVAFRFVEHANRMPSVIDAFRRVGSSHCDFATSDGVRARVTYHEGAFQAYHGLYLPRRIGSTAPSIVVVAPASALAIALSGERPPSELVEPAENRASKAAEALDAAAAEMAKSEAAREALRAAGGSAG
jgi:hypothetical protein